MPCLLSIHKLQIKLIFLKELDKTHIRARWRAGPESRLLQYPGTDGRFLEIPARKGILGFTNWDSMNIFMDTSA
jgi:hypothetical protein